MVNNRLASLLAQAHLEFAPDSTAVAMRYGQLVVEEAMEQVDERTFCRGECSWYDSDKDWVRLHFGYGRYIDELPGRMGQD